MTPFLLNLWDRLRGTFWLVPAIFCAAAVLATVSLPWLGGWIASADLDLPPWLKTTPDNARSTLAAIGSAMITVTGTVFSITIVTLSLASQQFGPRLLRRFMSDWPTQITLGVFLATGFFCLFALRAIYGDGEQTASADLAVTVAELLAAVSAGVLILYIHHIAVMIQATNIVAAVAKDLDESVDELYPEMLGEPARSEPPGRDRDMRDDVERALAACGEARRVASRREGYVQAIDTDELLDVGCTQDLVLRVLVRPGDFVARGSVVAEFWDRRDGTRADEDAVADQVNSSLIVGRRSTPRQDLEAAVGELVQVAVRALSPGINDPFTAIDCIDRLGASLGRLAERAWPSAYRSDERGTVRVVARVFDFPGVLDAAFHSIRQYGRGHIAVAVRLLHALAELAPHVRRTADLDAVRRHADMVVRGIDSFPEELDRQDALARYERAVAALDRRRRELAHTGRP